MPENENTPETASTPEAGATPGTGNLEAPHRRYFVTVHVAAGQNMTDLARFELDLIQATALATDQADGETIEGLLDLDQIGTLVRAGYRVTVEQPDYARSRADQITTFEEWLEGMGE